MYNKHLLKQSFCRIYNFTFALYPGNEYTRTRPHALFACVRVTFYSNVQQQYRWDAFGILPLSLSPSPVSCLLRILLSIQINHRIWRLNHKTIRLCLNKTIQIHFSAVVYIMYQIYQTLKILLRTVFILLPLVLLLLLLSLSQSYTF